MALFFSKMPCSAAVCMYIMYIWVRLKINQEGFRRFWSMFPLTRVPFWYCFFEPQPCGRIHTHIYIYICNTHIYIYMYINNSTYVIMYTHAYMLHASKALVKVWFPQINGQGLDCLGFHGQVCGLSLHVVRLRGVRRHHRHGPGTAHLWAERERVQHDGDHVSTEASDWWVGGREGGRVGGREVGVWEGFGPYKTL